MCNGVKIGFFSVNGAEAIISKCLCLSLKVFATGEDLSVCVAVHGADWKAV